MKKKDTERKRRIQQKKKKIKRGCIRLTSLQGQELGNRRNKLNIYDAIEPPCDEEDDMLDMAFGLTETYVDNTQNLFFVFVSFFFASLFNHKFCLQITLGLPSYS